MNEERPQSGPKPPSVYDLRRIVQLINVKDKIYWGSIT